jgi:hypothetical protein
LAIIGLICILVNENKNHPPYFDRLNNHCPDYQSTKIKRNGKKSYGKQNYLYKDVDDSLLATMLCGIKVVILPDAKDIIDAYSRHYVSGISLKLRTSASKKCCRYWYFPAYDPSQARVL